MKFDITSFTVKLVSENGISDMKTFQRVSQILPLRLLPTAWVFSMTKPHGRKTDNGSTFSPSQTLPSLSPVQTKSKMNVKRI